MQFLWRQAFRTFCTVVLKHLYPDRQTETRRQKERERERERERARERERENPKKREKSNSCDNIFSFRSDCSYNV